MATMTLADFRQKETNPLTAAVLDILRKESILMSDMAFVTTGSLSTKVIRTSTAPTISFRRIGNDHGSSKGEVATVEERGYSIGNYIDMDKVYYMEKNIAFDQRPKWVKDSVKAINYKFNHYFINGSPTLDIDGIRGLHYRMQEHIAPTWTEQQFVAKSGGLDVSPDASTLSTQLNALIDQIDAGIDLLPDATATHILVNNTLKNRLTSAARQLNLFKTVTDALGRQVETYRGAKIVDMGNTTPDGTTKVIGNAESTTDAATLTGGTATSAYIVRLGEEYLTPFQMYPLETSPFERLEDQVTYRSVIDWVVGLINPDPRAIVRIWGIVAA